MKRWMCFLSILCFSLILGPLPSSEAASSQLSVTTTPQADVYVDGRFVGKTPVKGIRISAGEHMIRYQCKSLGSRMEFPFRIRAGRNVRCRYDFEQAEGGCTEESAQQGAVTEGKVTLTADPWAEVFVNGILRGTTPVEDLVLAAGSYTVEFKHPDFDPIQQVVVVEDRKTITLDVKFEAAKAPTATPKPQSESEEE